MADGVLDHLAYMFQFQPHLGQDLSRDTLSLAQKAQKQVLCTNVSVAEALRLILCQGEGLARSFCEAIQLV